MKVFGSEENENDSGENALPIHFESKIASFQPQSVVWRRSWGIQ
jgi:hypothetical protein